MTDLTFTAAVARLREAAEALGPAATVETCDVRPLHDPPFRSATLAIEPTPELIGETAGRVASIAAEIGGLLMGFSRPDGRLGLEVQVTMPIADEVTP